MNNLSSYIHCIQNQSSALSICQQSTEHNSYLDDGIEISEQHSLYHFDNGVVISYRLEHDTASGNDQQCEECWISYEVVEQGEYRIRPASKNFYNACQQSFWLKMQTLSAG